MSNLIDLIEDKKNKLKAEIKRLEEQQKDEKLLNDFNRTYKEIVAEKPLTTDDGRHKIHIDATEYQLMTSQYSKILSSQEYVDRTMQHRAIQDHYGYSPHSEFKGHLKKKVISKIIKNIEKGVYDKLLSDQPHHKNQEMKEGNDKESITKIRLEKIEEVKGFTKEFKKASHRLSHPKIRDRIFGGFIKNKYKRVIINELKRLEDNVTPVLKEKTKQEIKRIENNTEHTMDKIQEATKKTIKQMQENGIPISDIQISTSHGGRLVFHDDHPLKKSREKNFQNKELKYNLLKETNRMDVPTVYIKSKYYDLDGKSCEMEIRIVDEEQIAPLIHSGDKSKNDNHQRNEDTERDLIATVSVGNENINYSDLENTLRNSNNSPKIAKEIKEIKEIEMAKQAEIDKANQDKNEKEMQEVMSL